MKIILTSLKTTIFFSIVLCLILFQNLYAQKGDLVLNFSGKDAITSNIVPLESVKVSNETQGGDTTLYGAAPTLSLQWASGIFEKNHGQKASFILEPNYPNPFTENTTVNIRLRRPQRLIVTIYDQQGAAAENLEQDFGFGIHRFEITVPQNRLCLLTVNDGVTTKTLKMFSTSGKDYRIKYLGTDENGRYKSETETAAFVFQPGDVLKYTVNAAGYYEYTTYDNPAQSTDYVFSLQPNITELPPTVTTAAVTNITATTAACGGNVTNEGSAAVTARGVCWNTAPGATIANSFTSDGAGIGAFASAITGLTESTTYYARAYATNQFGTAYGNEVNFTTPALQPFYACDSTITYSNYYGIKKTIYTRDVTGKLLKGVIKVLNTTFGVWVNDYQYLYTYDAQGNCISYVNQDWNTEIGSWVNDFQQILTYDAQGNYLSFVNQDWNTSIGSWVNDSQYLFTYDQQGNMLSELYQNWNTEFGSWVNSYQELYTYDAQGNQLSYTGQAWNTNIGGWVYDYQSLMTYDTSGNMLSMLGRYWDTNTGSWVNSYQELYTFDAQGNQLSYTWQDWNTNIGGWVYDYQVLSTYDASDNILSKTYQTWNTNYGVWMNEWKYLYTYDASGNMLSVLNQTWDTSIGSWVNNWLEILTYDASENELSVLHQNWDTNIGSWVNNWQRFYTYDAQGNQLSSIYQDWNVSYGTWVNVNKLEYQYDYTTRKITALSYAWLGGWTPVDAVLFISLFNNYDIIENYYCYKLEVWYNSYPSGNKDSGEAVSKVSDLIGIPKYSNGTISVSNPSEKEAGIENEFGSQMHAKEAWLNKNKNRLPSQNLPQRNMPVGNTTR